MVIRCFAKIGVSLESLILFVKKSIPCKVLNTFRFSEECEIISIDFSISNKKWLLLGIYNPPSQNEALFAEQIKLALNTYSTTYEIFFF